MAFLPLPADSRTWGACLAHDARCPAVGNTVMSVPISPIRSCAVMIPNPGIPAMGMDCSAKRDGHCQVRRLRAEPGNYALLRIAREFLPRGTYQSRVGTLFGGTRPPRGT